MAAEAAVSSAVQFLGDLLIQKINFLRGVEDEVRWLKDELKRMQSFLRDAAEKQADDERVRLWVSEIRELAHDAEDAIEIFVLRVESARSNRGLLGRCACFPNQAYHINKVGEEIESIRKRLQEIESGRLRYGIQDLGEATGMSRRAEEVESLRRLAHWQKDRDVVGLERDVELLLGKVILDEREVGLCSATVVGMGGIGKSTLARRIYNHDDVAARFEFRGWVVISSEFRPREVVKELMLQLLKPSENKLELLETMEKLEVHELLQMLHQRLQGTRYFIVVDDVWEDKHWEAIACAFPDEDKGSRLLLTSRNRVTTKYIRHVHSMKLLDPDESWELFLKKAFIENTNINECPQELENIGRQILSKCNGLPLAISVVCGLLVKRSQSQSEWEKVLKGINSHLGRSESNVSAILELSYQNLPPQLKPCFLSLAFFREDATIRAQKLVHIWIALGLVPQEGEETMEDIATSNLDELINRNMVQVKDVTNYDEIKNCQMHDLIRELCINKAKEEMSFEILREEGSSQSSHKPRHRAISFSRKKFIDQYSANQNKHVRSLFNHGYNNRNPSFNWKSFQLLRVLDLEGCFLSKLPNAMFALTELRYLRLSRTGIRKLPRSLGKLKNLLVLDLRGTTGVIIPNVIWKLDSLRHLYSGLIKSDVPLKLSTLKNIQTLSCILLEDSNLEQVAHMTSLRKLDTWMLNISDASKLFSSLAKLENLIHLHLSFVRIHDMQGLSTLHHITQLKLHGLERWPSVSDFPPNLSYLTLSDIETFEDPMPVLEKLPKLLYLKLMYLDDVEEMVISPDGFPKLKALRLVYMASLRNIQIGKGAMSSELKRLEFNGCLSLERLPEEVKAMSNLEELKIVTTTGIAAKFGGEGSHIFSNIPSLHLTSDPYLDARKSVL